MFFTPHIFVLNQLYSNVHKAVKAGILSQYDDPVWVWCWADEGDRLTTVWYYEPYCVSRTWVDQIGELANYNGFVSINDDTVAVEFKMRFSEYIEEYRCIEKIY